MDISEQTKERYRARFAKLGKSPKALGWGSDADQMVRFAQALRVLPADVSSILDIGCGFGDFLSFMRASGRGDFDYIGWDLTPAFVQEARRLHGESGSAVFEEKDLLRVESAGPVADAAVMFGLLNYNWKTQADNLEISRQMIRKALSLVRKTLVVDFLSTRLCDTYPKEDGVFYHDPGEMLGFALELCPNVVLLHDYQPIPQREFMIALSPVAQT